MFDDLPILQIDPSQPMQVGDEVMMHALDTVPHHALLERVVDVICNRTSNNDRAFFRIVALYFFAKMASSMRAEICTKDRGNIPVNLYAVTLATSGFGKGHSLGILEKDFMSSFRKRFMADTFPTISEKTLYDLACDRALITGKDPADETEKIKKEFESLGALAFSFDSATTAAIKQMRQKLLLSGCGALNLEIDEIGSNVLNSMDALIPFLELFDQGELGNSLRINSNDRKRGEELEGKTPANALLLGTPSSLFDGHLVEASFQGLLDAGLARRCIYAWGVKPDRNAKDKLSAKDKYLQRSQPQNTATIKTFAQHFALLADPRRFNWQIDVPEDIGIELTIYETVCIERAERLSLHETTRDAEFRHRHFRVLKIAGALAFVDESDEITMEHLYQAIKIVEESGLAFNRMLTREKNYVRLARYIAEQGGDLTHTDLHEALPFYKSSTGARTEMMNDAVSWGYKNHIIIRKTFRDEGIQIFTGETLSKTDLNNISFTYSDHEAFNYTGESLPFHELHQLVTAPGVHWSNHNFEKDHRSEQNAVPGFNMIAIDVDGNMPLSTAHALIKDFAFMTYTTKRHTTEANRYRVIIPTSYTLKLDHDDYSEFFAGILEYLPFNVPSDEAAQMCNRSKKWLSNPDAEVFYNLDAPLFDVLPFLPRTSKNETHRKEMESLQSLDNLERWFAQQISSGNRNNQLIKYALALVDAGMGYTQIEESLILFNSRLSNYLSEEELRATILVTVAKKIHGKPL